MGIMVISFPKLPTQLPKRGWRAVQRCCQCLFILQGWRMQGDIPNIPKAVVILMPHTSNIDAWYSFLAIWGLGLKISILAKHTLFKAPFAALLKWLGLIPVQRDCPHGLTAQVVHAMNAQAQIWVGMAPEGTRKHAMQLKSGFYQIAHAAQVPIVMFALDHRHKRIHCMGCLQPTGDYAADVARLLKHYDGKFSPIKPEWLSQPLQNLIKNN